MLSRIASAVELLARITAPEDPRAAVRLATAAVADHHEAGRPWLATPAELLLASLLAAGADHEGAAAVARGVLGDPARVDLLGGPRARGPGSVPWYGCGSAGTTAPSAASTRPPPSWRPSCRS
ncbi:hypothetical protein [Streptomyces showdoensis]|uniref:hypothetical protein n=1 Tax=Streptomyces showdoensis TaxID=68268 RepID=UPI00103C2891|nr:hypothetical protein [Streptomyces showdoensis]